MVKVQELPAASEDMQVELATANCVAPAVTVYEVIGRAAVPGVGQGQHLRTAAGRSAPNRSLPSR